MRKTRYCHYLLVLIPILIVGIITINSLIGKSLKDPQIKYLIGMSHPNLTEEWQIIVNDQIKKAADKIDNLSIIFTNADSSTYKQIKDINMLMNYGIDLLIITVNDANVLGPILSDINEKIPVIVLDRDVSNYDSTLYIGPDYYTLGKKAGERVVSLLKEDGGNVVEIRGPLEEPSVVELSHGFDYIISQYSNINIVSNISCEWLRNQSEEKMNQLLKQSLDFDIVFAHNNAMALGAYYSTKIQKKDIKCIGVSGLMSNKYKSYLQEGILNTTFLCPIGGKEAIEYAVDILNNEDDIPKKIILNSIPITKDNIHSIEEKIEEKDTIKLGYIESGTSNSLNLDSTYNEFESENINLLYRAINANSDIKKQQEEQIEAMQELFDENIDMIALSPVASDGWDEVFNMAQAKNIPIILLNNIVNTRENLWTTYIGSDYYEQGKLAASYLVNNVYNMKNDIAIAEIRGNSQLASIQRTEGFNLIINGYSRIKVNYRIDTDCSFDEAYEEMMKILKSDSCKVNVVFAHEQDIALGVIKAINDYGLTIEDDIIIITTCDSYENVINNFKINCLVQSYPINNNQLIKVVKDYMKGISPKKVICRDKVFIDGH